MQGNQRLKIGLVFDDTLDSNDGVAQYVKRLGGWLSDSGHEVSYLVGETKLSNWHGDKIFSLAKNIRVNFNGNQLSMPVLADRKNIKQILKDEKFDVLHVMVPYSPLMAQKVINSAGPSTAVIGTFHVFPSGILSKVGSRLLRVSYGRSLKKFSEVVSVSSVAASFAKESYGLNTPVIPNPVDVKQFASAKPPDKPSNEMRIVFLGRLVKRKGCRQLLEAFALVSKDLPKARLIIAGDGTQKKKLERLAHKLGISDKTEFLGFVDEVDKPSLLAGADVACFPSLYGEAFGIVLIEAMAAGSRVVLGGDNPGYRSVLEEQPKLLVDPLDRAAFASRLDELLNDQRVIDGIHIWQRQEIKQYDIDVVGNQILDVYNMAIARVKKRSHNETYEL